MCKPSFALQLVFVVGCLALELFIMYSSQGPGTARAGAGGQGQEQVVQIFLLSTLLGYFVGLKQLEMMPRQRGLWFPRGVV